MRRGSPLLLRWSRRAGAPMLVALIAVAALLPAGSGRTASAATETPTAEASTLRDRLARSMRSAGASSGALVYNASDRRTVLRWRPDRRRIPASNVKLFTTAAALGRFGAETRLRTRVLGAGRLDDQGVWRGDLYLRGGGDPTFGSWSFIRRSYGRGATVGRLARRLKEAGIRRVAGRVYGDESRFDSLRGGPASGYRTSIYVGPLSALSYNRGLANARGTAFQRRPPLFAAARLTQALERRGVPVAGGARIGRAPRGLERLASVGSPTMARLARTTNKPSDNFFAEMLLKGLGARGGRQGTTRRGARAAPRPGGAPARRHAPPAGVRLVLPLAGGGRQGGNARQTDAPRSRARPLSRQDRHALERQRPIRLLPGPLRRPLRLLDPHEPGEPRRRPRPSGPDGARHRRRAPLRLLSRPPARAGAPRR